MVLLSEHRKHRTDYIAASGQAQIPTRAETNPAGIGKANSNRATLRGFALPPRLQL